MALAHGQDGLKKCAKVQKWLQISGSLNVGPRHDYCISGAWTPSFA